MAGHVCAVANRKGGVGKTTAAVNLGIAFSRAGYDTVVVDADLEMPNLVALADLDPEYTVHDVLAGDATVSEALTGATDGLVVVPGHRSLEAYADADPAKLRNVVETLETTHDLVIIDTGPGLCHETTIPLKLSDSVILALTQDGVAINDAKMTGELVERVDGTVVGGLLTQVDDVPDFEAIETELGYPVLGIDPMAEHLIASLVHESPDSDRTDAFERLAETLGTVFFEGADSSAVERVYEESWVGEDESEEGESEAADEDDDDDYTHAVFHGI